MQVRPPCRYGPFLQGCYPMHPGCIQAAALHMHTQVLKSASALGESFGSRHVRELHTLLALQPSSSKVDALALTLTPTLALALALTLTPSP